MIGVVVWSNLSHEKAIIWCEDQATLAYLQGYENLIDTGKWPEPGDLVELETKTVGNLRHALEVSVISEQVCPELPKILADAGAIPRQPKLRVVHGGVCDQQQPVQAAAPRKPMSYHEASLLRLPRSSFAG